MTSKWAPGHEGALFDVVQAVRSQAAAGGPVNGTAGCRPVRQAAGVPWAPIPLTRKVCARCCP